MSTAGAAKEVSSMDKGNRRTNEAVCSPVEGVLHPSLVCDAGLLFRSTAPPDWLVHCGTVKLPAQQDVPA